MRNTATTLLLACAMLMGASAAQAQVKTTPATTKAAKKVKPAKAGKASKAKTSKKASSKTAAAVVDTVSVADFSYAMGLAQSEGLVQYLAQRLNVDTTQMQEFMRGFNETVANPENKKLANYSAGIQIGQQVTGQIIPSVNKQITDNDNSKFLNEKQFMEGFTAGAQHSGMKLPLDSAKKIVQKQMTYYHGALMEKKYGDNRRAGEEFLAKNAKNDSVKLVPDSRVQYKVLKQGNGAVPKATDKVKVNYEGKLIDGTVFDSSYKRNKPATFECNRVIKGWTEALTHMPVGSTWEIYIPQDLAYGDNDRNDKIKPYSTLIFKVELLSIEEPTKKEEKKN
jgi:FKBP-type peptidyl-prolyl cis-trans isomerase